MSEIASIIREIAGTHQMDSVTICDATIDSVDISARTCVVTLLGTGTANTLTVRLMANANDGSLYIPTVGSSVIITFSNYVQPFVSMYSSIESIVWLGGEYFGVPIVKHPTDATKGLLKQINDLEDLVKHHISQYNAHIHSGVTAGAGVTGVTNLLETGTIINTSQTDIEHPNITH